MFLLVSIKIGGCFEDCGYCLQVVCYYINVEVYKFMFVEDVVEQVINVKVNGLLCLCMGVVWCEVCDNWDFDMVIEMVQVVNNMDMEVCCIFGMLMEDQVVCLKNVGLFVYNYNFDILLDFYDDIIFMCEYEDCLNIIENVCKVGIIVCLGGIIGMGEVVEDCVGMLLFYM